MGALHWWLAGLVLLAACSASAQRPATTAPTPSPIAHGDSGWESATGDASADDADDDCSSAFYWEHLDCPLPPLVALDEIQPAGVGVDEIPPIDEPRFASINRAREWLTDESPLLVVTIARETRAYPLAILVWHEVVNDVVGGVPVVVTYCPLCNTGLVFERTVDGEVLDFGTSGHLWRSNLVMYDRQHENFWSQVYGRAIAGTTFEGRSLTRLPALQVSLATLAAAHPGAMVLSRDTGVAREYGRNPYARYEDVGPFFPAGPPDDRLPRMTRVVGIGTPAVDPVAITLDALRRHHVVELRHAGEPIVVFWAPGQASAVDAARVAHGRDVGQTAAFSPVAPDGRALTFSSVDGRIVDDQTGSEWNLFGQATAGALDGAQLQPVIHEDTFWFAWQTFHSATRIVGEPR